MGRISALIDEYDDRTNPTGRTPIFITVLCAVGILLLAVLFFGPQQVSTVASSNIRICNATGENLKGLKVGDKTFGDMPSGAISGYQIWKSAYRFASVSAQLDGREYASGVEDFAGELPLGSGEFTYAIVWHSKSGKRWLEAKLSEDASCVAKVN